MIQSFTLPLHRCIVFTTYIHFPGVSNYDSNPAVSVRFIDSTTLPLRGDLIYISSAFSPTLAAPTDQHGSDIPQD
jgi:hypothetical protein